VHVEDDAQAELARMVQCLVKGSHGCSVKGTIRAQPAAAVDGHANVIEALGRYPLEVLLAEPWCSIGSK
jgi:hypothetical protein